MHRCWSTSTGSTSSTTPRWCEGPGRLARKLFRFDAGFIDGFLVNGTRNVTVGSAYVSGFFDKYVVDGWSICGRVILEAGSRFFRGLQTGLVSQYALVMAVGMFVWLFIHTSSWAMRS